MIEHDPGLQRTLEFIGKRWTGAILYALQAGPQRFNRLMEIPGISDRMLSDRLAALIRAGLIERRVYSGQPVRVEYRLTDRGKRLRPLLDAAVCLSE